MYIYNYIYFFFGVQNSDHMLAYINCGPILRARFMCCYVNRALFLILKVRHYVSLQYLFTPYKCIVAEYSCT